MSIDTLITVAIPWLLLAAYCWVTERRTRRRILRDVLADVDPDDYVALVSAIRRRLGPADTPREIAHVLRPLYRR